ncbi:protein-export chaperone SecB [Methylobacillus sp.]|uniref:protein-export chaperone SecB n=1 Tax=Methylobacillus sp. TaxID=56818 RepID=UPI002FE1EEC0
MAEEQAVAQDQQPAFGIEKIYVKDLSLEIPNAPQIFTQRETPQVSIELSNATAQLEDGIYEVTVTVTVTSKLGEKTVFLVEVAQAGIFQIRNVPQENLDIILGVTCPNIVFPYARETISDIVTRAGFPPILLNPVNFEALYAQQKQEQAKANGTTTH